MQAKIISFLVGAGILGEDRQVSFTSLYLFAGLAILLKFGPSVEAVSLIGLIFTHCNLKRLSHHAKAKEANKKAAADEELKAKSQSAADDTLQAMNNLAQEILKIQVAVKNLENQGNAATMLNQFR